MPTYYVPIERVTLPDTDPLRWLILPVETDSPVDAMIEASHEARGSIFLHAAEPVTIWAAVRDIPEFAYMQYLRDSLDVSRGRRAPAPVNAAASRSIAA